MPSGPLERVERGVRPLAVSPVRRAVPAVALGVVGRRHGRRGALHRAVRVRKLRMHLRPYTGQHVMAGPLIHPFVGPRVLGIALAGAWRGRGVVELGRVLVIEERREAARRGKAVAVGAGEREEGAPVCVVRARFAGLRIGHGLVGGLVRVHGGQVVRLEALEVRVVVCGVACDVGVQAFERRDAVVDGEKVLRGRRGGRPGEVGGVRTERTPDGWINEGDTHGFAGLLLLALRLGALPVNILVLTRELLMDEEQRSVAVRVIFGRAWWMGFGGGRRLRRAGTVRPPFAGFRPAS